MSEALVLAAAMAAAAPAFAWEVSGGQGAGFGARVSSSEAVKGADGKPAKPVLSVSCGPGGLYATIAWPDAIPLKPNQHFVAVAWSLDGASRSSSMLASSGSVGLAGSEAKEWLREFAAAKRLQVRVPDAHGGQSASFDLAGAKAVQDGIARSACG
jgi:hypothetical protein